MTGQERISNAAAASSALVEGLAERQGEELSAFSGRLVDSFNQGGRLFLAGVGPLGELCNLLTNNFLHRLSIERPPLPAISLCRDSTLAASVLRDGQDQQVFSRQLRVMGDSGDVVLILGDGWRSPAIDELLGAARQMECLTAALIPDDGGSLPELPDFLFRIDTESVPRFREGVLFFGQLLCELVEGELFGI